MPPAAVSASAGLDSSQILPGETRELTGIGWRHGEGMNKEVDKDKEEIG
jgi:hypothetical protein